MVYEPSIVGVSGMRSAEEVATEYVAALASNRDQESRRRMTLLGPHRDDLILSTGGRDLRTYGSGGERRTAALALRLLEVETARARRGREAILLLDDIFAELDDERSHRLLTLFGSTGPWAGDSNRAEGVGREIPSGPADKVVYRGRGDQQLRRSKKEPPRPSGRRTVGRSGRSRRQASPGTAA